MDVSAYDEEEKTHRPTVVVVVVVVVAAVVVAAAAAVVAVVVCCCDVDANVVLDWHCRYHPTHWQMPVWETKRRKTTTTFRLSAGGIPLEEILSTTVSW